MKRTFLAIIALSVLLTPLVLPKAGMAFWPFDKLFQKGQVMGEQTDAKTNKGIFGLFTKTTPTPIVEKKVEDIEDEISEEKLTIAVKNRFISETQRKEILARLKAIKVKREELKKMREAFVTWLKENNIERSNLVKEGVLKPSVTPTRKTSITPAERKEMPRLDKVKK